VNGREALRKIWSEQGLRGLYVGFNATLITSCFASAVWWQSYEYTKAFLYQPHIAEYVKLPDFITSKIANMKNGNGNGNGNNNNGSDQRQNDNNNDDSAESEDNNYDEVGGVVNRVPQLAAGFIAGTVVSVVVNPLDVVYVL